MSWKPNNKIFFFTEFCSFEKNNPNVAEIHTLLSLWKKALTKSHCLNSQIQITVAESSILRGKKRTNCGSRTVDRKPSVGDFSFVQGSLIFWKFDKNSTDLYGWSFAWGTGRANPTKASPGEETVWVWNHWQFLCHGELWAVFDLRIYGLPNALTARFAVMRTTHQTTLSKLVE